MFTSLPIVIFAVFDYEYLPKFLVEHPTTYYHGRIGFILIILL